MHTYVRAHCTQNFMKQVFMNGIFYNGIIYYEINKNYLYLTKYLIICD
jgi:hypothetical protein